MPVAMPQAVAGDVAALRAHLTATLPRQTTKNLLIATWNIRAFGDVTDKWVSGKNDTPKRDLGSLACIAEVIRRFDVVALQEVRRNVTALMRTLDLLGPDWRVIASDVTEGDQGNDERIAFVYNTTRVRPSGLVAEIVLPVPPQVVVKQFARTPYVASFSVGTTEFILVSLHVLWGRKPGDRLPEIVAIAEWMRDWAARPGDWNTNLLVLGDFNLDRLSNPLYQAFTSTGLWPPAELNEVRRTIFGSSGAHHFYDQIAWFGDTTDHALLESLTYNHAAGSVDFVGHVMSRLTKESLSWRISDHLPLWVEFKRP